MWNAWFAWFGNTPEGAAESIASMEVVSRSVGRDPAEIHKTVTVLVRAPGGSSDPQGSPNRRKAYPIGGTHAEVAESLVAFADAGVDQVQLVVDPITTGSIEWLGGVLAVLDGN
jgi:alkanesulfonate monooxygenase SsuD/methylene tetrahydromethanopterin reductase-like flavin-dependent oxidoreductase (luciferase family)